MGLGTGPGEIQSFAGVYDGHGGSATADWLKQKFFGIVQVRCMGKSRVTVLYWEHDTGAVHWHIDIGPS